jgi:hypothetical protein
MQNLPFTDGLQSHIPTFLQQVEQVFGLEAEVFAEQMPVFCALQDIQTFEEIVLTSPLVQFVQPQFSYRPSENGAAVVGLELALYVAGEKFLSFTVFDGEGYALNGYGFRLHSADEAKVTLNTEALVGVYFNEPFSQLCSILENAVAAFPVAALVRAQQVQADILSLTQEYTRAVLAAVEQVRGNMLRTCTLSPALFDDLPGFLGLVDKALTMAGVVFKPSLVDRWNARVTSVGAENIRASDVEAVFRIPSVPLMMYAGVDEEQKELRYVWVPLTLTNKSVIHLEVGGDRGHVSLLFDFASLVVGSPTEGANGFDPEAFQKFERSIKSDEERASYQELIVGMLKAFAPMACRDERAERVRRRALLFISCPQMDVASA